MTRQSLVIGESISGRSQVAQPQVVPCGSRKNGRSNDLTPDNVLLSVSPLATGRGKLDESMILQIWNNGKCQELH